MFWTPLFLPSFPERDPDPRPLRALPVPDGAGAGGEPAVGAEGRRAVPAAARLQGLAQGLRRQGGADAGAAGSRQESGKHVRRKGTTKTH